MACDAAEQTGGFARAFQGTCIARSARARREVLTWHKDERLLRMGTCTRFSTRGLVERRLPGRHTGRDCLARNMNPTALHVLLNEHQALSAVLRSMSMLLIEAKRQKRPPDFGLLRAMLFYIDEFPERLHHAHETQVLFPLLRKRAPQMQVAIERLDLQHHASEMAIRDLEHALNAYEFMGESRREDFETRLARHTRFYVDHMGLEEREIVPALRQHLTSQDWAEADRAFSNHRDPLTGHEPTPEYRSLFQRLVMTAPAPIGLGSVCQTTP